MDLETSKELCNFYDEGILCSEPERLNEYRKEKKFTDLILLTRDGTKYDVHKNIISLRCPYFEGIYNSDLKESQQSEIKLDRVFSPNNFEEILTYIYTGRINITTKNVFAINENACYLGLKKLKEESEKALVNNINLDNVLTFWRWAEKFSNNEVKKMSLNFIQENAGMFFNKYILNLEYNEVQILASNQDFDQDQLYTNLTKWIKEDFKNREKYVVDLLKSINFIMLSDDIKNNQIETDTVLLNNINFLKVFANSILTKASCGTNQAKNAEALIKNKEITIPKAVCDLDDLIFTISRSHISFIKFKAPHPRFVPIAEFTLNETFQAVYNESDNIFYCGLEEGSSCKNFCYRTNTFNDLSPMIESRKKFGITKLHEKIFVCGGESNKGSVEIYDINTDKWMYGKSMSKQQLYDFKAFNYNHSIYTLGGSYEYQILNEQFKICNKEAVSRIIQRYDPRENVWETVSTEATDIPHIYGVFGINDSTVRCIFKNNLNVCGMQICDYDVRNNAMRILPIGLPEIYRCVCCKFKDDIFLLTKSFLNKNESGYEKKFGRLDTTSDSVKFTELPDLDLSSYHGCKNLLNVGPDQYNYLNSVL